MLESNKKILITGGTGALGTAISEIVNIVAPSSEELDITNDRMCHLAIEKYNPDIVIHAAAYTDVSKAEIEKEKCWSVNVEGTINMLKAAEGRRFVYISTSYVFDGEKGNYSETDIPNPVNFYALTKLLGETAVRQYPNTLIIRTAFKKNGPWPYRGAFTDQWMSVTFASDIAPDIVRACLTENLTGVIHIAGERKTIYDLAKTVSPEVGKISVDDVNVRLPRDTSLDSSLWEEYWLGLGGVEKAS